MFKLYNGRFDLLDTVAARSGLLRLCVSRTEVTSGSEILLLLVTSNSNIPDLLTNRAISRV